MNLVAIAELCRVLACSSQPATDIDHQQASCQSYYVDCVAQRTSTRLSEDQKLQVCVAARPAFLLAAEADRAAATIRARKRIEQIREEREAFSGRAE